MKNMIEFGPFGCLITIIIWLYSLCASASILFFSHEAWHIHTNPNIGNLLLDFFLVPVFKGLLWPFFI